MCVSVSDQKGRYIVCVRGNYYEATEKERKKEGNGQMRDLVHCVHVQIETNEIGYFDTVW